MLWSLWSLADCCGCLDFTWKTLICIKNAIYCLQSKSCALMLLSICLNIYQWARQRARDQSNLKIVSAGLYTTLWHMCQQPPATNDQPVMECTLQTGYCRRSLTGLCGCVNGGFSNQFHCNYLQPPGTTQKLNSPSCLVRDHLATNLQACVTEAYEVWFSILVHKT